MNGSDAGRIQQGQPVAHILCKKIIIHEGVPGDKELEWKEQQREMMIIEDGNEVRVHPGTKPEKVKKIVVVTGDDDPEEKIIELEDGSKVQTIKTKDGKTVKVIHESDEDGEKEVEVIVIVKDDGDDKPAPKKK